MELITFQRRPTPIERVLRPFQRFAQTEAGGGILLLICAVAAMILANSRAADAYFGLWELHFGFRFGGFALDKSLHHWINDGLMAIFFFVVGLEIKREILVGELSSLRKSALPIAGALGGVLLPAGIYASLNAGGPGSAGWAIPMATDIAFAIGVLTLLGKRVPVGLKVFLTALAIVDDIAAVMVIAIFYTADLAMTYMLYAAAVLALMALANLAGVRSSVIYFLLGWIVWYFTLKSGIHATIAGVMAAMTIPTGARIRGSDFVAHGRRLLERFEREGETRDGAPLTGMQGAVIHSLEKTCEQVESPAQRLEHGLHPYVAFLIMPLFALSNAGVAVTSSILEALANPIGLGIILGLFFGKQIGISLAAWIAVRLKLATLPRGVSWIQLYGVAMIGGIGFTMSLFVANLGFSDPALLDIAKLGVLCGSLVSGIAGYALTRTATKG
jgi:NhaA family Na+:H+ antiporter